MNDSQGKAGPSGVLMTRLELARSHARHAERAGELHAILSAVLSELQEDSGGLTTPTYLAACKALERGDRG